MSTIDGRDGSQASIQSLGAALRTEPDGDDSTQLVERVLALARTHLGLDVAWFSRFGEGRQNLDHVEGDVAGFGLAAGVSGPYEESYCARVLAGQLPNIVRDARADERTRDLSITAQIGIGAYVGVPVTRPDGEVYGMMCCIGHEAASDIDERDLKLVRLLAEVLGDDLRRRQPLEEHRAATVARIDEAINGDLLRMVFQPIVRLPRGDVVGVEALSRFDRGASSPEVWFREAAEVGRGADLELASLRKAVAQIDQVPRGAYLSINASPALIALWLDRTLPEGVAYHRLVLEITEHAPIADYGQLNEVLTRIRDRGMRIAVDDAGAGYASFRHILQLKPDFIKLDTSITRGLDRDPSRRALASAFTNFAREVGATLVAEGVETEPELDALTQLGVTTAQGYLFARPGALPVPSRLSRTVMAGAVPAA